MFVDKFLEEVMLEEDIDDVEIDVVVFGQKFFFDFSWFDEFDVCFFFKIFDFGDLLGSIDIFFF